MDIDCHFEDFPLPENRSTGYACKVTKFANIEVELVNINGKHAEGKTDQDIVTLTALYQSGPSKLPQGIGKLWPNLRVIQWGMDCLQSLSSEDLEQFPQLESISMARNEIEELKSDVFKHTPNLFYIDFQGNRLQVIAKNVFDGLKNLQLAYFSMNPCVDIDAGNPSRLEKLKQEIASKCSAHATTTSTSIKKTTRV